MRLFLFGISAFSYWLTVPVAPRESDKMGMSVFAKCEPSTAAIEHLCAQFPFLPRPVHVSTNAQNRKVPSDVVAHVMSFRLRGKAFCHVGNGLYAACPELCFAQLAQQLSFHELVRAGNVLCGRFCVRPDGAGTLAPRNSLTSKRRIGHSSRETWASRALNKRDRLYGGWLKGPPRRPRRFSPWCSACLFVEGDFSWKGRKSTSASSRVARREPLRAARHSSPIYCSMICDLLLSMIPPPNMPPRPS